MQTAYHDLGMNMSGAGDWYQTLGGNLKNNYIYTVNVSVGMPPQYAQFIVDSSSPNTYVFSKNLDTLVMAHPDKFYDYEASMTYVTIANETLDNNRTIGITMYGATA